MRDTHSDALVFFGATGDLAYKKIFPSLQAMAKRGNLNVPVIGVAKAGWTLDQLRARAQESVEKYGGLDRDAFAKLCGQLRYVDGDYRDPATFQALRRALGDGAAPRALPGHPAAAVRRRRGTAGAVGMRQRGPRRRRETLRPRPRLGARPEPDPARHVRRGRYFPDRPLPRASGLFTTCCSPASRIRFSRRSGIAPTSRACRSRWRRTFGIQGRGSFYDATGAIRDVVQNHLFQLLSNLAMEPPARTGQRVPAGREGESPEVHSGAGSRRIRPGQFRGYRAGAWRGCRFAGRDLRRVRLRIDSWRWQGVPFYIRAGKCLPVTSTEVVVRLRRPPTVFPTAAPLSNYFRFRILPRLTIAFGVTAMDEADQMIGQRTELVASRQPGADERAAYERVLSDALEGDADAVCADGLRRRGVADRRSGAGDGHAGSRIRAGDLGPHR